MKQKSKIVRFHTPALQTTCDPGKWIIQGDKHVGSGVYGDVYRACLGNNCDYVAKVIPTYPEALPRLQREVQMMYTLGQLNLAPRFQTGIICNDIKKLAPSIEHYKDFKTIDRQRTANIRDEIISPYLYDERDLALKRLLDNPLYTVIFSNYIPHTNMKGSNLPVHQKAIREALLKLFQELNKLGVSVDLASPENVRVYETRPGKWVAKLIDVGLADFGNITAAERRRQEEFINHYLEDLVAGRI